MAIGENISTRDSHGIGLVHVVAQTEPFKLTEYRITAGADINVKDNNTGLTPLDYAQGGETKMIEIFERHGGKCTKC